MEVKEYVDLVCALVNIRDYLLEILATVEKQEQQKNEEQSGASNQTKDEQPESDGSGKSPRFSDIEKDSQHFSGRQYKQITGKSSQLGTISLLLRCQLWPIKMISKDQVRFFILMLIPSVYVNVSGQISR